jgi:hypothetical protein
VRRGLAGAVGVALFVAAAAVQGGRPEFDAPAAEAAAWYGDERTRIQLSCALFAAAAPFLVWFLATVAALAREAGPEAEGRGALAYGCGLVFVGLFLVDVTTLGVGSLRPENMTAEPELAVALGDLELLLMGTAAFPAAGMLAAFAALGLRDRAIWPRWVGRLAAAAAALYLLRVGTLFTADGPFAADGALGLYVPVTALAGWIVVASIVTWRLPRPAL